MATTTIGGERGSLPSSPPITARSLRSSSNRTGEKIIRLLLASAAGLSVVTTFGIVVSLLYPALGFFSEISVADFLFGTRWAPQFEPASFGVLPLITATLWTTVIALVVAVPFGLGAAIYLSEYALPRVRKTLKPILEILAGIPTVVYGFFALQVVQTDLFKEILGLPTGAFSVLAAGLVMGVMIIPTIASLSEDAFSAVPMAMRQGSAALGANRMQTTLKVVFPAALSGIVAAVVLGISRAVGETMIVALAAGGQARIVGGPLEQGQTMTGFIASAALGDSRVGSLAYDTLFAVGLLLFVMTLIMNVISIRLVRKYREAY